MINGVEIPDRIKKLRMNGEGYPVPWFVAWVNGRPDFRVIGPDKWAQAVRLRLCWICGEPLGKYFAFVIGPMCAINRVSSEPPSHLECATFAARVCPFLTQPSRGYRPENLPAGCQPPAGQAITRNPGVALVWVTTFYQVFDAGNGLLIEVGAPEKCVWYAHGREASRGEILESIAGGLPELTKMAKKEGPEALASLKEKTRVAMELVPA